MCAMALLCSMLATGFSSEDGKGAILVVSFGTSYNESRDLTIGAIENAIQEKYPDYEVRRAFTSQIIIDKLKERDGLEIDNVTEALDRAVADGITELVVQPTHLMHGFEYTDLQDELEKYTDKFDKVVMGEPLLNSDDDFSRVADVLAEDTADYVDGKTAVVFMGHGTEADSNEIYAQMQGVFDEKELSDYYVGTVEAEPSLDDVIAAIDGKGYTRVVLEPLMVVAGDHANNDMAGDEDDSWKTILTNEGYEVGNMGRQRNILLAVISAAAGIGVLCAPVSFSYIPSQVYAAQSEQTAQTERTEQAEPADQTGPAEQAQQTEAELSSMVASDDERAAQTLVGPEGCYAKYADEIEEGVYEIDADSSSSMFKIVKAELTVKDGDMSAVITLSGKGYLRLFMGTGMEAVKADPSSYAEFQEDADGAYTYEIPVEALDKTLECTGFSKRKEKWYDHQICFMTSSLPEGAVKDPIENGEYSCDVTLTGGTGKASVESPAKLTVEDDLVFASIIWSSPNYDYMKVGGRQYLPVNERL